VFVEVDIVGLDRQPAALRHGITGVDGQVQQRALDLRPVGQKLVKGEIPFTVK